MTSCSSTSTTEEPTGIDSTAVDSTLGIDTTQLDSVDVTTQENVEHYYLDKDTTKKKIVSSNK